MLIILQIQPGITLIIGFILTLLFFWVIWPKKGGLALISKIRINNKRALLEDALKYIFNCEYNKTPCEINGFAEHLNMTIDKADDLITRLQSMDLVDLNNKELVLTDAGRSYALRIVRIHRIWERYLADETSIAPADWHSKACEIEHLVTEEETERLAAQIGNPVFDPHGDPIPTADGYLPNAKGVSLSTLQEGEMGRIIHLEDEPKNVYEQLLVLGLYLGMQVYVTDVSDKKITFIANGEECILTPHFANQITIERTSEDVLQSAKYDLLSTLEIGEQAEVKGISHNCRGQQRRRLMDLGIIPGSTIAAVIKSASGDPVGYRVMGTTIGIRKQHANYIFITRKN